MPRAGEMMKREKPGRASLTASGPRTLVVRHFQSDRLDARFRWHDGFLSGLKSKLKTTVIQAQAEIRSNIDQWVYRSGRDCHQHSGSSRLGLRSEVRVFVMTASAGLRARDPVERVECGGAVRKQAAKLQAPSSSLRDIGRWHPTKVIRSPHYFLWGIRGINSQLSGHQ